MKPTVTRRALLRAIGVAGGAGVLFESMRALGLAASPEALATPDYRPPAPGDLGEGKRGKKVVILGAGMAGLVTAYELGKAGYDCVVLEAKNRVGGRNWTVRGGTRHDGEDQTARFSDGQYLNAGPARLPQSHITLDYCRELGVPLEVFTNQNANALIYNEQTGVAPQQFRTAKADMYGYVSELLAKTIDQGSLDQRLTAEDKDRLLTFLSDFGAIGAEASGFAYTGTGRRGYSVEVEVGYQDRRGNEVLLRADYCVATLPPHVMARVPTNLDPRVTAALRYPFPLPVGKLGLEYRRRW